MLPVIEPMLATPGEVAALRDPEAWHYEVKWDGYRAIASVGAGEATFRSRGGLDFTRTYPELGELAGLVGDQECVLDGEVVALGPDGRSDFGALQNRKNPSGAVSVHYMVFDVLHLAGESLLRVPYVQRRELLEAVVEGGRFVHVPETFGTDRALALEASTQLRLEGLVAKRAASLYLPGRRSPDWVKGKNLRTQEVVVVGWKPGAGRRGGTVGSLLLAVPGPRGLECVGGVGTGFTQRQLDDALARLAPLARDTDPGVAGLLREEVRDTRWVEPALVGEVAFSEWSHVGRLRHPVWRGWREDKRPDEVVREV